MGANGHISKARACTIATVIICAVLVSIGLGLGLGLRDKSSDTDGTTAETTTSQPGNGGNGQQSDLYTRPSDSIEGHYRFAAVAADAKQCSQIGNHVMAVEGGTAVDAAIAAILCVGVHNAHSAGIGGGHFLTYYNRSSGQAYSVNAREQAPSGATQDMYVPAMNVSSTVGGIAAGIPGEVRGLHEIWKLGGRLPWQQLLQPAIGLCKNGFKVTRALADAMEGKTAYLETPDYRNIADFLRNPATGEIYKEGDTMYRPKLARTLEIIAAEGPDAFYNGSLSQNITLDLQETGGIITQEDLANYTALVTQPLMYRLHDNNTIYSPPLPSSGVVYQFILNVLDGFRFTPDSVSSVAKATQTWHRIIEAFKHAYSLRTQLGDANVGSTAFKEYIDELVQNITDPEFGAEKRQWIIDSTTFPTAYYNPKFYNNWDHGTAHLSVVGPNGDAVAITSTINLHFGGKVIGKRTGIIFNNEMDDFSTPGTVNTFGVPASEANFIEPWKRPLSSMCPSIVVAPDGQVKLVAGASGGTKITTSTAEVTLETLWLGWGIKQAIDYPRVHDQLFPPTVQVEEGFPQAIIDGLKALGHNITMKESAGSVVQGVLRTDDMMTANSDFRKGGAPDGY